MNEFILLKKFPPGKKGNKDKKIEISKKYSEKFSQFLDKNIKTIL